MAPRIWSRQRCSPRNQHTQSSILRNQPQPKANQPLQTLRQSHKKRILFLLKPTTQTHTPSGQHRLHSFQALRYLRMISLPQSAQPEQKSEQPKQSAQSDQRLTQKETTGNSSADVKNKGVSHPAPKKKKTAVVIGIIAMAAVIIIGIIAAVKMFGSSDAKETAKDSTYKEVKENAAEKESKPAKKENVKPKKETDGEMKKDSGQEEKSDLKKTMTKEDATTEEKNRLEKAFNRYLKSQIGLSEFAQ